MVKGCNSPFFFYVESYRSEVEYINADDVIAYCPHFMKKISKNLIKIRSCTILRWLNCLDRWIDDG